MNNEFIDERKEFVIRNMYPVRPWLNYAWNTGHISSFNQFGFGMSRYTDENGFIRNILSDADNRIVFIKDNKTGEYYAANRNYDKKDFEVFETVVGQGYSEIHSQYNGIKTVLKLFVPDNGYVECWELSVENVSQGENDISIYPYANVDTGLTPIDGQTRVSYLDDVNCIHSAHNGCKIKVDSMVTTNLTNVFFASETKPDYFETSDRRFKGVYSHISHPEALSEDNLSSQLTCFELKLGMAMQFKTVLASGEKKIYRFLLGAAQSPENTREICKTMLNSSAFDSQFKIVQEKINDFQSNIFINTPDSDINTRVNIWLKRQIEIGKQWGRLYGKGFRDVMQDTMAFLPLSPSGAKERILYSLQYQKIDGNPVRQWDPYLPVVYADGGVWLIYTVNAYLKETNDFNILKEKVKYFDSETEETVFMHCQRAIDFLQNSLGEHGLCLWRNGDWNDSLNGCGVLGKGESVWLSMATYKAANEFIAILEKIGMSDKVEEVKEKAELMKKNILEYGWDKDHFIYGINDYGEKIGAYESDEGNLYLNTQTWAVLSDIADDETAKSIMNLVEQELSCEYGYILQKPAYSKSSEKLGRVSYLEMGVYENGSVYNHGVAFKAVADCKIGKGNIAYESIKKISPTNPYNVKSGVEAYMMSNMYFGPENATRKGDSPQGWITGTGGWLFRCIVENIIGVQSEYEGLTIKPNLPDAWDTVSVKRVFRNVQYNIEISKGNEDFSITVDGESIDGNVLPIFDGGKHDVKVVIKK